MKLMVINGPNLNLLGSRQPNLYGRESYQDLLVKISQWSQQHSILVDCRQSNHEGDLVDWIQEAKTSHYQGLVLNPAAYTHTSIAIRDALLAVELPAIEVHLSEIKERENYRQISYIEDLTLATIQGQGIGGYILALDHLSTYLNQNCDQKGDDK